MDATELGLVILVVDNIRCLIIVENKVKNNGSIMSHILN